LKATLEKGPTQRWTTGSNDVSEGSLMAVQPYRIVVSQEILGDPNQRIERTRWIDDLDDTGSKYGLSIPYMRARCDYVMPL
jgi:epoxide hydrolase